MKATAKFYRMKCSYSIFWLGFLIMVFCVSTKNYAQTEIPPAKIVLDSVNLADTTKKSLIQKIIQPIRFRDNRIKRERQTVYDFLKELTNEQDLSIDTATISAISDELVKMAQEISANDTTGMELGNQIQQAISLLDTKASKEKIDSIQFKLESVLKGLSDQAQQESKENATLVSNKLQQLRQVNMWCDSGSLDSLVLETNQFYCLQPKGKVFGWYSNREGSQLRNKNLGYLTDLILYGYDLNTDGSPRNSTELTALLTDQIVQNAINEGKNLSLSIFSESAYVVNRFLQDTSAQNTLIKNLSQYAKSYHLKGATIYFEEFGEQYSGRFSSFISKLKSQLSGIEGFELSLSLPALRTLKFREKSYSYDFTALNRVIDYYLIHTNELNVTASYVPFSPSPLYHDPKVSRGSIEQTINFYLNSNLPLSKVIMTVGYLGITWPKQDFEPYSKSSGSGREMTLNRIQSEISFSNDSIYISGFDPEQASPYINYQENDQLRQVWFEDGRSLYLKYVWAVEQQLGGVAVWGYGNDDFNFEFQDALAAAMFEVDTIPLLNSSYYALNNEASSEEESLWSTIFSFDLKSGIANLGKLLRNLNYIYSDLYWASSNNIQIIQGKYNRDYPLDFNSYCEYSEYTSIIPISDLETDPYYSKLDRKAKSELDSNFMFTRKNLIMKIDSISSPWDSVAAYNFKISPYENKLQNDAECACLLDRWDVYRDGFMVISLILLIVIVVLFLSQYVILVNYGDNWPYMIYREILFLVFLILCFFTISLSLFFNGSFDIIGAGSESTGITVIIVSFVPGLIIGCYIIWFILKKTYEKKDLP